MTTLRRAGAFVRRDARIERTYRAALAGQLLGGLLFLCTFALLSPVVRDDFDARYGTGYLGWAIVGVTVSGFLITTMQAMAGSLRGAQLEGTLEATLMAPAGHAHLLALMGTWPVLAGAAMSTITISVTAAFGVGYHVNIASLVLAVGLSVVGCVGLGLVSAAAVLVARRGDPVAVLVGMLGSLSAGAYAPVATFPGWLQTIAAANPLTYALQVWRGALLLGSSPTDLANPLAVVALTAVLVVPVGWWLLSKAIEIARTDGLLAGY